MHTNHKLNFGHNITFEIFQDNDSPRLEILINEITVFDETFTFDHRNIRIDSRLSRSHHHGD